MYRNIAAAPGGISGEIPEAPKFAPFWGKYLGGFGTFLTPILPVYIMLPIRGGGGFSGRHFRVFAAGGGTHFG